MFRDVLAGPDMVILGGVSVKISWERVLFNNFHSISAAVRKGNNHYF